MKNCILCIIGLLLANVLFAQSPKIKYSGSQTYSAGIEVTPLIPVNSGGKLTSNGYMVSTFAGSGIVASNDGIGVEAGFYYPMGLAVDSAGYVYVVDRHNNKIRKISPSGKVVTLAGSGVAGNVDGKGAEASFNWPYGIDLDAHGNAYVADRYNNTIRKITPDGTVTTFAGSGATGSTDGIGTAASFNLPTGLALDSLGNIIVADTYNNLIRKITPDGEVTTIAGTGSIGTADGVALQASFNVPTGVDLDASGNIWVADVNNNMIRKISASGIVTTVAGTPDQHFADGKGTSAGFFFPYSLIMDISGDFLVADANNNRIRKVTKEGVVTTIAGYGPKGSTDGEPTMASFSYPADVAYDSSGNIFVADAENHKIRKIAPKYYSISPLLPLGLSFDYSTGVISGKPLKGSPTTIYKISTSNASGTDSTNITITVLDTPVMLTLPVTSIEGKSAVGNGKFTNVGYPYPTSYGICWSRTGIPTIDSTKVDKGFTSVGGSFAAKLTNLLPKTHYILRAFAVNSFGTTYGDTVGFNTAGPAPEISYPVSEQIFIAGTTITPIPLTNNGGEVVPYSKVSTFAGNLSQGSLDGTLLQSSFNRPYAVAISEAGDMYVADTYNHKIRLITPDGMVKTLAGSGVSGSTDGLGALAQFSLPIGLTVDKNGNVFVADSYNNRIRKITKDGNVVTIAGNGNSGSNNGTGLNATFNFPTGIVIDTMGNLFVADSYNYKIRKIDTAGVVSTFAGNYWGSVDGIGEAASFDAPGSIAIDRSGNLYVTDWEGNKVRKITPGGVVSTLAGSGATGSADGQGTNASFNYPTGIAVDSKGNLWIADNGNNKIRMITPTGLVSTAAGTGRFGLIDGESNVATFKYPNGIGIDSKDGVFVTDANNYCIRLIYNGNYYVSPALPSGLNIDTKTGTLYGMPSTGSSMTNYSIIASNAGGNDTAFISIAVKGKPTTSTLAVQSVSASSANVHGCLLNVGYPTATLCGTCWNKSGEPFLTDSIQNSYTRMEAGVFDVLLKNLAPGTTYYVRTFATNSYGTSYGEVLKFTTLEIAPKIQYVSSQIYSVNTEIMPLVPTIGGGAPTAFLNVSTLSGNGTKSSVDGLLFSASYSNPSGIAIDVQGNIFIADAGTHKIRKISTDGMVTTFAGSGFAGSADGKGNAASFNTPRGIAIDAQGNVFVADTYNQKIRKISKEGDVTTLAGSGSSGKSLGIGAAASFYNPTGVAVDTSGNVYVADKSNHRICKINSAGNVTTLAGNGLAGSSDGKGLNAYFYQPSGVTVDVRGNVYVADYGNNKIRKITPDSIVTTIAGQDYSGQTDGIGSNASFYYPIALSLDSIGNLYVVESSYGKVRKITPSGEVTSYAGQSWNFGFLDGISTNALFNMPSGIALDKAGIVYVADYGNNRIRKIAPAYYTISPSLPDGLNFDGLTGTISGKPTTSISKTYTVYAFNTGGEVYTEISLSITPMGIKYMETNGFSIYPNPTTSQFSVSGLSDSEILTVYSLTGVKLLSQEVSNGEPVDISKLKSGLYMVKVGGHDFKLVKK